jgi:drug/metabolite transporter (DMT)-like permease
MTDSARRLIADLSLLSVAIVWGATFVVVKESVESTPVFSYLFLRFGLAFLVLLPWLLPRVHKLDAGLLGAGVLLGFLYYAAFGTQTLGLAEIPASISAFLTGLYVIAVPLLAWGLFHRRPGRYALYASLIASAGLWFLTSPGGQISLSRGEWLSIACALLFALHIIATDYFTRRYDTWLLVGIQLLTVSLLSGVTSLLFEPSTWPKRWDGSLLLSLLITGILATAYALWIQTRMQRYTTPTRTAIIFAMEPVSAGVFGVWVGGETLTLWQILGGGLIVAAMLLAELKRS